MKVLGSAPPPRLEKYASAVLHDEPNVRVVAFRLEPGQVVPAHTSPSTVLVHVIAGAGTFVGSGSRAELRAGESALYQPAEPHSITASSDGIAFLAVITPRPS
ncbi:MAG TPA: cupin domain-containing protein [Longimicrobiales bacterium]|nr:cupin domain-containing protein [Longimicrobiales bacterium]